LSAPHDPSSAAEWAPASPCIGVCLLDPATAEIARWYRADAAEKRQMPALLAERRRSLR
jgi:predicted Fe-S protein YdhL (DUF1289 family)